MGHPDHKNGATTPFTLRKTDGCSPVALCPRVEASSRETVISGRLGGGAYLLRRLHSFTVDMQKMQNRGGGQGG